MLLEQPSASTEGQDELTAKVRQLYTEFAEVSPSERRAHLELRRDAHARYTRRGMATLPAGFISLDASRPWLTFWMIHSLSLLEEPLPAEVSAKDIVAFLASCQDPDGGFGGGPGQLPHLAPTYAAVATLVSLGEPAALGAIDRAATHRFLRRMCVAQGQGGGFHLCEGGEVDVRGCYCAMATAHMLGLDAAGLAEEAGMVQYVQSCQTYQGGIGGEPGNEAHGGYAFCGLAALVIAGRSDVLDLPSLTRWAVECQGQVEGGFMGRTNKLVDGCYSYWMGALFPLLATLQPALPQPTAQPVDGGPKAVVVPRLPHLRGKSLAEHALEAAEEYMDQPSGDSFEEIEEAARTQAFASAISVSATSCVSRWGVPAGAAAHSSGQQQQQQHSVPDQAAGPVAQTPLAAPATQPPGNAEHTSNQHHNNASQLPADTGDGSIASRFRDALPALYDAQALQLWLLQCCQVLKGGLRDKPGKPVDYYHTCYCLSGLSSCQHYSGIVVGPASNLLAKVDLLCNVVQHQLVAARQYFARIDPE